MTTAKKQFSFRLSRQAADALRKLVEETGMTQAATIEYALILMAATLHRNSSGERS